MHRIETRTAGPADRDVIAEFNCRLAEETEGRSLVPETVRSGVAALLADPRKGRYLVACANGQIVGQLMHTFEWSDWRNGDIWWLQSVYVAPEFRRRGVFRRLCERLLQEAEADPGVVGVRLYVEDGNQQAQEVYRRMGLREAGYRVMERMFGPIEST